MFEDMAAEQKARTVYENLLRVIEDPDVRAPLKFLRTREIVHFQRFGEALEMTKEKLDSKNFYYFNPEFDKSFFDQKHWVTEKKAKSPGGMPGLFYKDMYDFLKHYEKFENGSLRVYIDKSQNPEFDTEIYIDSQMTHYPLRDYKNIWNEMNNIVKD